MKAVISIVLVFGFFFQVKAQDNIKELILDDLLLVNEVFNGCLIQSNQEKIIVSETDTFKSITSIPVWSADIDRVKLLKIDSLNSFYFVDAKFDLIPNYRFSYLFANSIFSYVLYRSGGEFFKIDGFFCSDILNVELDPEWFRSFRIVNAPRSFSRLILKRKASKIKEYLSVSVIAKINEFGFHLDCRPYVKDRMCF